MLSGIWLLLLEMPRVPSGELCGSVHSHHCNVLRALRFRLGIEKIGVAG